MTDSPTSTEKKSIKRESADNAQEDEETKRLKLEIQQAKAQTASMDEEIASKDEQIASKDEQIASIKEQTASIKEQNEKSTEELRAKRASTEKYRKEKYDRSLKKILMEGLDQLELYHPSEDAAHPKTGHKEANATLAHFPMQPIFNGEEFPALLDKISMLQVHAEEFSGRALVCYTEADLQFLVRLAVDDAVHICNLVLAGSITGNNACELISHREVGLFTNRPDHIAVVERSSGLPVFICNTTVRPEQGQKLMEKKQENGQVFDLLSALKSQGHPSPFGAITTFEETHLVCLPNDECTRILEQKPEDMFNKAVESAIQERHEKTLDAGQSKLPIPRTSTKEGVFDPQSRELLVSNTVRTKDLVSSLVNGILLGLNGFVGAGSIPLLRQGSNIVVHALQMEKKKYQWGNLNVKIQGQYRKKVFSMLQPALFLVGFLGVGSTSRVYRATTIEGEHCVVKMYICNYDKIRKMFMGKKDFAKKAKTAIDEEKEMVCTLYEDAKPFTFVRTLNSFRCLVQPYYEPIAKNERESRLEDVCTHLCEMATKLKKKYRDSDMAWRHLGLSSESKVRCIDLGDLEELGDETPDAYAKRHCQVLEERLLE